MFCEIRWIDFRCLWFFERGVSKVITGTWPNSLHSIGVCNEKLMGCGKCFFSKKMVEIDPGWRCSSFNERVQREAAGHFTFWFCWELDFWSILVIDQRLPLWWFGVAQTRRVPFYINLNNCRSTRTSCRCSRRSRCCRAACSACPSPSSAWLRE